MKNFAEVLAHSKKIEGWMVPHAAALFHVLLSHQVPAAQSILEIGVFKGKSAVVLAYEAAQRNETLILMDIRIQPEIAAIKQLHSKSELIETDSFNLPSIAAVQAAAPFRFIHIDGSHHYSCVLDDIKNSARILARNGIICLDDFLTPSWPEVTVATFDYLAGREHDLVLFLAGFNKGFLCRSIALQSYCELIEGPLAASMMELGCAAVVKKRKQNDPFCFYGIVGDR
jgi:predicted O-methyltransferase YrrM